MPRIDQAQDESSCLVYLVGSCGSSRVLSSAHGVCGPFAFTLALVWHTKSTKRQREWAEAPALYDLVNAISPVGKIPTFALEKTVDIREIGNSINNNNLNFSICERHSQGKVKG